MRKRMRKWKSEEKSCDPNSKKPDYYQIINHQPVGEREIDNSLDALDIKTSSSQVSRQEDVDVAFFKPLQSFDSLKLRQVGMKLSYTKTEQAEYNMHPMNLSIIHANQ